MREEGLLEEPLFQAVIFDFDGVIVDSEPLHYLAIQAALTRLSLGFSYKEYLQKYVGLDDRGVFRAVLEGRDSRADGTRPADRTALDRLRDELRVHALCRLKASAFSQFLLKGGVPVIPGAVPLIRGLRGRGVPLAVASGALESEIRPVLERLGLLGCFAAIVSADQVAASKPDPATYRLAVERLAAAFPERGLIAGSCLAIEDTACGVASARAAGLRVLALTTTTAAAGLVGADGILPNLERLSADDLLAWRFSGSRN
jgi:beta-phosphoglucomutase